MDSFTRLYNTLYHLCIFGSNLFWILIWDVYTNVRICVRQIHKTNKLLLKNALITIAAQKSTRLESFTYLIKNCSVYCKQRCRRDLIIQLKIFQDCVCRIIWRLTLLHILVSWVVFRQICIIISPKI